MHSAEYIILFFLVFAGGLIYFLIKKSDSRILKLSLAFSGAYLFGMCILHLLPEVYSATGINIGLYVLAGFLFQVVLEYFSEGIEHGHIHVHAKHTKAFPFSMMLSLCIHSFTEGMALSSKAGGHQHSLLTGIILHHIPVAFALMSMLIDSKISRNTSIFMVLLFAGMAPLGALTSSMLNQNLVQETSVYFTKVMAVVIGIFLHISTTILFESQNDHRFNLYKLLTILAGVGLVMVV